jgi:ParB family chromosome partitioning protein
VNVPVNKIVVGDRHRRDLGAIDALAASINAAIEDGDENTARGVEAYRRAGEGLLTAQEWCLRNNVPWLVWRAENIKGKSYSQCRRYMNLALKGREFSVTENYSLEDSWRTILGNDDEPPDDGESSGSDDASTAPLVDDTDTGAGAAAPDVEGGDGGGAADVITAPPHVAQATGNPEWYTPVEILNAARTVLGGFDLDPASSDRAQENVRAVTFYTKEHDGLSKPWSGRVWLNPPYANGLVDRFAEKLATHFEAGEVTAAAVLVNNSTETRWFSRLAAVASAICFPRGRVRFLDPEGNPGAPLQGQAVLFLGADVEAFVRAFAQFGFCARVMEEGTRRRVQDCAGARRAA